MNNKYLKISLIVLAFLGCCVFGYKNGYDKGVADGEYHFNEWMMTHEKYRLIIEKIWDDMPPEIRKKYREN